MVGRQSWKQGIGCDKVHSEEGGKHWDQLHEKGVNGKNTYMTLPYNYAPRVTRDEGDTGSVRLKRGIVLHEGITGHPLKTFSTIS